MLEIGIQKIWSHITNKDEKRRHMKDDCTLQDRLQKAVNLYLREIVDEKTSNNEGRLYVLVL